MKARRKSVAARRGYPWMAFLLAGLVCVQMCMAGPGGRAAAATLDSGWSSVSATDWMAFIDGSALISQVNLPGTHDSAAQYMQPLKFYWCQCQGHSVGSQLNMGARFLDLRLNNAVTRGEPFRMCHNSEDCYNTAQSGTTGNASEYLVLSEVLRDVYNFLDAHPTEFVVASIKLDNGSTSSLEKDLYDSYISKNPDRWYTGTSLPTVDQARGKIVLVRRYNSGSKGIRMNAWSDDATFHFSTAGVTAYVEDNYGVVGNGKWNKITPNLDLAKAAGWDSKNIYLTFTSCQREPTTWEKITFGGRISEFAEEINGKLNSYNWTTGTRYGWIPMDYLDGNRARLIFSTNRLALKGSATVKGTAQLGGTLSVSASLTSGATYTRQWYRGNSAISGATGSSYTLTAADVGKQISCRLTGTGNYTSTLPSFAVTCQSGTLTGTVTLTGSSICGQTLKATMSPVPMDTTLSYQWLRNGAAISGDTESAYTLTPADVGQEIACRITGSGAYAGALTSTAFSCQSGTLAGAVTVMGNHICGETLSAVVDPIPEHTTMRYQWLRNGDPISGASDSSYTLTAADVGQKISCRVTGSDGYIGTLTSTASTCQSGALARTVILSGSPIYGQTLTASLDRVPEGTVLRHQWYRGSTAIAGATESSYTLTVADVEQKLFCRVTGQGAYAGAVDSSSVTGQTAGLDGAVTLSGPPAVGQTLTASLSPTPSNATLRYQWYRETATIAGATKSSYTLTAADVNRSVSCRVTASGAVQGVLSSPVVTIQSGTLEGVVTLSGEPVYGKALTAVLAPAPAGSTLRYQWYRGGSAISEAVKNTYTLTAADLGQAVSCQIASAGAYTGTLTSSPVIPGRAPWEAGATPAVVKQLGRNGATVTNCTVGQEYAVSRSTQTPETGWQDGGIFTGLIQGRSYYIHTRTKETETHTASQSAWTMIVLSGQSVMEIGTAEELQLFAKLVREGDSTLSAVLTADIDLTGQPWIPVGSAVKPYQGVFDGGGFTISNMEVTATDAASVGMFGELRGAAIQDLALENCRMRGNGCVGILAGRMEGGSVRGCTGRGSVCGVGAETKVGGLIGDQAGDALVAESYGAQEMVFIVPVEQTAPPDGR